MLLLRIIALDYDNIEDAKKGDCIIPEFQSVIYPDVQIRDNGDIVRVISATDFSGEFRSFVFDSNEYSALRKRVNRIVDNLFHSRNYDAIYVLTFDPEINTAWEVNQEYLLNCDEVADDVRSIIATLM